MERRIGKSGGVTIPSALRRSLGIVDREKVDLQVKEDGSILLRRIEGACVFCGAVEEVAAYRGRFVCRDCAKELGGQIK